jgi:ABC-2 type transport system permease protein
MTPIFGLTLRSLARGRRLLAVAVLMAVPALLAVAYVASEPQGDGGRFAVQLFDNLVLPILLPLAALIFATNALGGEVEDRTLVYLTLRPIGRLGIVIAKLAAATLIALVLVEISLAATYAVANRGTVAGATLGAILLAGLGGCLAYGSLFLLVGLLVPRRALVLGFIYVLVWEGAIAGFSAALATLTVRRYVEGILHAGLSTTSLAAVQPANVDGLASTIVLALIVVGGLALSTWSLHRIELP